MFSLILVLILASCGVPPYEPDPSAVSRPEFNWLDGHEESIMDGDHLKVTVQNGRMDAIVREAIFNVNETQLKVNQEHCAVGYILMYFAKRVGNKHYSRLGCKIDLDADEVHLVEVIIFPNDSDKAHYICLPPHPYPGTNKVNFECKIFDGSTDGRQ